jgi:Arc/MetJ family transcription regulator
VYRDVYGKLKGGTGMRTNIVLNDSLVEEAFQYAPTVTSKRELIEVALLEYVNIRKRKNIRDLRGKSQFRDDYDYKAMRAGT